MQAYRQRKEDQALWDGMLGGGTEGRSRCPFGVVPFTVLKGPSERAQLLEKPEELSNQRLNPTRGQAARAHMTGSVAHRPASVHGNGLGTWEVTLALLIVAIVIAGVGVLLIMELWLSDRVLPGVHVWDVDVGGQHPDDATAELEASLHYPADRHPTLRFGDLAWPVDPVGLGTELDVGATADAAFAPGHRGDLRTRLQEQIDVLLNGRMVMPVYTFDSGAGAAFLSSISPEVNRSLRNATVSLNDDLKVEVIPGRGGREVDEEATQLAMAEAISEMSGGKGELVVRESEPLLTDLRAAQAQAEEVLRAPIALTAPGSEPWTIEPKTLAKWLLLQPATDDDGIASMSVKLDAGRVAGYAEKIGKQIYRPAKDGTFRWNSSLSRVEPVESSEPGLELDVAATVSLIEEAAFSDQRTVALPTEMVSPAVATEDMAQLGIRELIAEGKTGFAGSTPARVTNIVVGAAQFDGLLIAPGEIFSFNHYLGEVTAAKGYEKSIIIWGNETRADVGGGLCQVSSTAFRAAFWAGLPIVERWPHTFRVSYYEPPKGLDATIYSPTVDLKFRNNTGHYILIHTVVNRKKKTVAFRFYGTDTGRTVEMDGPYESRPVKHGPPVYRDDPTLAKGKTKQIEWAKDGLDVTVNRVVKENGVEVRRDKFFSRYRPWRAVYLRGTKAN